MWIDEHVRQKEHNVVIKLYNNEQFIKSIIIPTNYYPLHNENYKLFTSKNCDICEDKKILSIFDSIKFQLGHCYTMNGELYKELIKNGIDAKIWAGWLFVNESEIPIHHCWVTVKNSLLDIADDNYVKYKYVENADIWKNAKSKEDYGKLLAQFYQDCIKNKITNSQRCKPCGKPVENMLYIGSECKDGNDARNIYKQLIKRYPNHEAEANCDNNGENEGQRLIKQFFCGNIII